MARSEDLTVGTLAEGIVPGSVVTIKSVSWTGNQAVEVIFEGAGGRLDRALVFRDDEHAIDIVSAGRQWSFEADRHLFRLVSDAHRIRLAWPFDPFAAITTSPVDPLPHQISAVYEQMLPRLPLRFLLADDLGAGKTIMASLLIKDLMLRGELKRCLSKEALRAKLRTLVRRQICKHSYPPAQHTRGCRDHTEKGRALGRGLGGVNWPISPPLVRLPLNRPLRREQRR